MENIVPQQPINPSPKERLELLHYNLTLNNRPEDLENIINLFNPPPHITSIAPTGSCKGIKVAVLGGGLAGLSAAFELRQLGFDITIFEAEEKRIGGRVFTYYFDRKEALYGELGPMRFPVGHQSTWHYVDKFFLNTRPFIGANENTFRYVRGIRSHNTPQDVQNLIYPIFNLTPDERRTLWPALEARVLEDYVRNLAPEVRKEILELRDQYSPEVYKANYFSLHQAMQKAFLSDGAIDMLTSVNPFLGGFINVSHLNLLQDVYPLNFTSTYEITGGITRLPWAFHRSLMDPCPKEYGPEMAITNLGKISWRPGHQITGLSQYQKDAPVRVHFKATNSPTESSKDFDFVVCSIPFSNLRLLNLNPVFSNRKMQAIRLLNMSAGHKTVFLCNYRFWEAGPPNRRIVGGTSSTDLVINSIIYPSDGPVPPHVPGVITASYSWTQDAVRLGNFKDKDIFEIIKRQIEEVHGLPKFALDPIVVAHKTLLWNNHPWALGAFTFDMPKQNSLFSKASIAPEYCNRVFFAGEHVSNAKGWMQGALQTGMLAANGIAHACRPYI